MANNTGIRKRINVPWADLPTELLSIISDFAAANSIDILAFRAVCKSWNSSSAPTSPFILSVMLPITSPYPAYTFDERFFDRDLGLPFISITTIFLLRHPEHKAKCWLMFVDQLTPGKMMIRQPFTKCRYDMPVNFPSYLDVQNIHIDEIAKFYNFSFQSELNKPPSMWSEYAVKVVLNSDESVAFALFHNGLIAYSKLRVFPNWESGSWESVEWADFSTRSQPYGDGLNARIDDIVNYNGKLMCVDRIGRVYVVDFSTLQSTHIVPSITNPSTKRKRLVESNGLLYLVVRESVGTAADVKRTMFTVFELDEDLNQWVEVSSLHGRNLFFGLDFSFSGEHQQFGCSFGKNCIVYKEGSFRDYDDEIVDDDDVILFGNLSSGEFRIGVWRMEDPLHCDVIGSYPGCSDILWPPPAWLWPVDMSKRVEDLEGALDNILANALELKFKAMSENVTSSEQVIVTDDEVDQEDEVDQQDEFEIWSQAHTFKARLNEARDILTHLESVTTNVVSRHQLCESKEPQNQQVGSSSRGRDGSEQSQASDVFVTSEMKLHSMILHLEESTSKLQNTLKSRHQSSVDVVE